MISQFKDQLVAAHIAVAAFVANAPTRLRSERGQASAEYVGVIIVGAIIVLALITGAAQWGPDLASAVTDKIGEITKN